MRSSTFALPLLASLAMAQPHKQVHQHAKNHVARNEPAIEWVTEYAYTTEVVPVTKTIWVSSGFVAPTPQTTSSSAAAKATVPAQFFQPASKKPASSFTTTLSTVVSAAQPTTTSSTTSSVAPPPPAVKVVESSTSKTTTTTTPAPVPTPVSVYTPPPAAETSTTVASSASSSTSSGGECSKGSSCNGDITYYEAGLGACGSTTDGETEDVIALSHLLMGTQSNGNPYCGKTVTIKLNGKSIVAKVVDKCMGCEVHAIDLSNHAFKQLEDMGVGRTQAEWYFN